MTYLGNHRIGAVSLSKPNVRRNLSAQSGQSSHMHSAMPNTTDFNAYSPKRYKKSPDPTKDILQHTASSLNPKKTTHGFLQHAYLCQCKSAQPQ